MDQITFEAREKEKREKYPDMFSHPKLRIGEIFFDAQPWELAYGNVSLYKKAGLKSARIGKKFLKKVILGEEEVEITYQPFFADLREYMELEAQHQESEKSTV